MCEAIYIGNTQNTSKKRMDINLSDLLRLFKNGKKSDSFYAHFKQHFKYTTSRKDLCKCMAFKLVNHLNPIVAMKIFTEPN